MSDKVDLTPSIITDHGKKTLHVFEKSGITLLFSTSNWYFFQGEIMPIYQQLIRFVSGVEPYSMAALH